MRETRYDVDFTVVNPATGKPQKVTVSLTPEESVSLQGLATQQDKQAFLSRLPSVQAALKRFAEEAGMKLPQHPPPSRKAP